MTPAIATHALRKVYAAPPRRRRRPPGPVPLPATLEVSGGREREGGPVVALDRLDLAVAQGEFFGLLGPNGAGKTTTIGILTTRIRPTGGEATVGGADVVRDPVAVRQRIGVVPQRPNPDRSLNVIENLLFHAAYFGVPRATALPLARGLLDRLGLGERETARVDHLSGGQQQRLMIVRALMHAPDVLFLDEPTVGLDPQARLDFWEILRGLHAEGRTIVMTTHYMEEADQLCDRVAIVDHGRLLACDTPARLKAQAPGGTVIAFHLDGDAGPLASLAAHVAGVSRTEVERDLLRVFSDRGGEVIPAVIDAAGRAGRTVRDIALYGPSLESLFIALTGRTIA